MVMVIYRELLLWDIGETYRGGGEIMVQLLID